MLELVIVVLILGISTALVAPRFQLGMDDYRAALAARQVKADLELASTRAQMESQSHTIGFDTTNHLVTISGLASLSDPSKTYQTDLAGNPYSVALISADFAGSTSVTFDMHGTPTTSGTVTIEAGNVRQAVHLDAFGKATIP